jgi:polar amino acid transport system substrate-binding protein
MKKSLLMLGLAAATLLFLTRCNKKDEDTYRFAFHFITEDYKPLNYLENDTLKGLAPEVLKQVCLDLHIPYEVDVLPWAEGYQKVQSEENAVLFCTMLNATRKDLFKWAGPIASLDWFFYSVSGNQLGIKSLDDARNVSRIGVLRDYAITQSLQDGGFTNLVYCDDNLDGFNKLISGEIDLFPSDKITAEAALKSLGQPSFSVNPELIIRTDMIYFAFNKSVPDDVVTDFQIEIDKFKTDGTLLRLTRQYLGLNEFPGILQIYTEQYPPLTYRNGAGEITGFGTDVVREIMKRNLVFEDIRLTLWNIGYEVALHNPNVCLFTMDRTPNRESLFQWVGPIGSNITWFYTKAGSGITVGSLEEARALARVGTVSSWFSTQHLTGLGFTNLVSDPDPVVMAKKLMKGEVDAFVCSGVTFPDILREAGYKFNEVVPSWALMSSDYYIAFSLNTPATTVGKWQSALLAMKADGTYQLIARKWLQ